MTGVVGAALRGFGRALKAVRKKTKNLSSLGLDYPVIKSVDPKVHKRNVSSKKMFKQVSGKK